MTDEVSKTGFEPEIITVSRQCLTIALYCTNNVNLIDFDISSDIYICATE